ncbi:hypothetical protein M758_UG235700 [Ceratodon purpureus]|nr:hypothetical protein M758_UG235700 [Ceratodon purpureus]
MVEISQQLQSIKVEGVTKARRPGRSRKQPTMAGPGGLGEAANLLSLGILKTFTAKCGWPTSTHCILVTSISSKEEWFIQLELLEGPQWRNLVVSVDDGFSKFVGDNQVSVGDLLVFEWVDDCCLVVTRHRCSPPTKRRLNCATACTQP